MKKLVALATTLALTTVAFGLEITVESGDSFNKVMSKNRTAKKMKGANYVEIKNSNDLAKHGKEELGITVDGSKNIGTVYNYVEIKNAKSKKDKFHKGKDKKTNKYNSKNKDESRNIGVKVKVKEGFNRGFRGRIHNSVKIDNSDID